MNTAMATTNGNHAIQKRDDDVDLSIIERVIALGDLRQLSSDERVRYYVATCKSVGLNPMTKPFDYLQLNGKLTLYATKNCTDQLRQLHGISVKALKREERDGLAVVYAHVVTASGREDQDMGAVSMQGLKGEALANALMKATTKAKRRATLSICGLSMMDESEVEAVPTARRIQVDHSTGDVLDAQPVAAEPAPPPPDPQGDEFRRLGRALAACDSHKSLDEAWPAIQAAAKSKAISKSHYNELAKMGGEMRAAIDAGHPPDEEAP